MLDDASGGGTQNGMMAGYVADHTAYSGALQTALGVSGDRQHHDTRGNNRRYNELADFEPLKQLATA